MTPTPAPLLFSLALAAALHVVLAATPQVDFDRMGKVGLAGAFAGLDLFSNSSVSFDPTTSSLLSRASDGSLTRIASTNSGGSILAGCALDTTFYLAGSFSSIDGVPAANIASYTPSSGAFAALGSNGPNGQINALFCDPNLNKVWAAGSFSSPGNSVALFDTKAASWSSAPFLGISGAQADVTSITTNASDSSLFFAGSFVTSFGSANVILNGTNNPNVPFSAGATPFSSSLVPIPLQNAQVDPSSSTSEAGFNDINNILCPAGSDGSGNTWFAADNMTPLITIRTFTFLSASGVRLGNTFQPNHGTTSFSVTTIPDNNVRTLKYIDPTTGQNVTCSDSCPLSSDSSLLYQDYLFDGPLDITGVQITLLSFSGSSAGLHILQLLSSGAFASSIPANNTESCFAPNPSNSTQTGTWTAKVADTGIPGTVQTVLVSEVDVGTTSSAGPTFTWIPYVSAAGNYDISLLVPGCTNFQDCASRTSVQVTIFPGTGIAPFVANVSQQNTQDATTLLYSGPILPSSPERVTTIIMALAPNPAGAGQNGKYELVADRVELILTSANATSSANSTASSASSGLAQGFGFLEWPRTTTTVNSSADGTKVLPNATLTALDTLGFDVLAGLGGVTSVTSSGSTRINAVAHHPSGAIFVGGTFNLTAGPASGSANIISFKSGALAVVANSGLNGAVSSLVLNGDQLYVGGTFTDTQSATTSGKLSGIALYNVQQNAWTALGAGVNGPVTSLGLSGNQVQVAGNFTTALLASGQSMDAPGFATWDIASSAWVNSGGFVSGDLTLIVNGTTTSSGVEQLVAGNVRAAAQFGASGFVMLKNGDSNGPVITPLAAGLSGSTSSSSSSAASASASTTVRRRHVPHLPSTSAWISHMKFAQLFGRQTSSTSSTLSQLPAALPATAPAVLAGAFWTNSTSGKEITVLGGNFTFLPAGSSGTTPAAGVALYDSSSGAVTALHGAQINGTVRALLVDGNSLFIGGEFTLSAGGASVNGLALYDLAADAWSLSGLQSLQGDSSGGAVVVRSLTTSALKPTLLIVAGTFAQAGSLRCEAICSFDTVGKQWNALGSGIQGEVASIAYAGDNQNVLIAGGSIALSDNTASNVLQYSLENTTWASVGLGSDIPGPVSAIEVNAGNASSLFAAGTTSDGTSSFLTFWNGITWATLGASFDVGTTVAQLTMVPLQNTHTANSIIESDRVLMIAGSLTTGSGNASAALFDGESLTPYFVVTAASGTAGSVSSLFHSFSSFSFSARKFLATGVVILISIAIAAGVVFLLALIGILWTLFSRKDDKLNKFDAAEEEDDDSTHHRPSSLLEHINAATRTTIMGGASPHGTYSGDKEPDEKVGGGVITHSSSEAEVEADPFGPDASNYMRAETPSDAVGGMLAEETSRPAHARYSFDGTGEGELPISSGAEVEVLDDRDPAWWYARDVRTGREGVVPAAYLY